MIIKRKTKPHNIRLLIGGASGSGKSTIAVNICAMEQFSPALYLDIDRSAFYYKDKLKDGSEYIEIESISELVDVVGQVGRAFDKNKKPFKTIVIDTWYFMFKMFSNVYDEKNGVFKNVQSDEDVYNIKRKTIQAWGDIKSPFTKLLHDIYSLPVNIICLTWQQGVLDGRGVPIPGKFDVRCDSFVEHMSDSILRIADDRTIEIKKDRTKIFKTGDKITSSLLNKLCNLSGIAERADKQSLFESNEKQLKCEICGASVPKSIADATSAQNNGKPICIECLKKK